MDELVNELETVEEVQYIVVKLGDEQYGIDIGFVDNIVRLQQITRVPKSQPYFVGVINLRGEVVPIMSLRRRFGLEDDEYGSASRIIIIRLDDQALIGFMVDEVKEVVNIDPATVEKPTFKLDEIKASYLAGIGKHGESLISLLDIQAVVDENKAV
ncbi:MAG: purine-binding chemotaxis protein CheW [Eubacterium sp.]|jgi:Chemotaxis signal transduction protein|nr:purine-binding chemotaxis protein CheW [Eubacterium sp.]